MRLTGIRRALSYRLIFSDPFEAPLLASAAIFAPAENPRELLSAADCSWHSFNLRHVIDGPGNKRPRLPGL